MKNEQKMKVSKIKQAIRTLEAMQKKIDANAEWEHLATSSWSRKKNREYGDKCFALQFAIRIMNLMIDPSRNNIAVVEAERVMPADFAHNAALHYAKALRKHPRFADALFVLGENDKRQTSHILSGAAEALDESRKDIVHDDERGTLIARYLLGCEFREAFVAYLKNDQSACVDELYDAVAVLMRMIAVVEGKQHLGKEN